MSNDPYPLQPGEEFELLPTKLCGCPENGTNGSPGWRATIVGYDCFDGDRHRYRVKAYPPGAGFDEYRRWWVFKEQLVRHLDTSQDIATDDLSILM